MPVSQEVDPGIVTRSTQIAQRRMCFVRDPHWSQIATAQQSCEVQCIAAIRFDALAGLSGDQARGRDDASRTEASEVTLQAIAARPCF
jgi:hypothetical protein